MQFDFEIVHISETKHEAADIHSRLRTNVSDCRVLEDDKPVLAVIRSKKRALIFSRTDTRVGCHAEISSALENGQPMLLIFFEAE